MSARPTTWLACSLSLAIMAFGASLLDRSQLYWSWYVLTHPLRSPEYTGDVLTSSILIFAVPAYLTVGAVVASLRPKNGVGWVCLALSIVVVVGSWQPENLALIGPASFLSELAWYLTAPPLPVTLLLLIFPDGRLPSRRWWVVVGMAVGGPLFGMLIESFRPYLMAGLAADVAIWVSLVALLASLVALLLRWRRSQNPERQQIKLLVYAAAVTAVAILSAAASSYVLNDIPGAQSYPSVLASVVAFGGVALGIPVAIGVAILKHHLYDVDVVINRTLVYGALTVLLVAIYLGGVVLFQYAFRALSGQGSQLAVVGSTLAIAALFNPLRRRIQALVDRRFYRGKYDARKTLEAFSAKLRDETDLDALGDDLTSVARETMQPAHVSLWLLPDTNRKSAQAR